MGGYLLGIDVGTSGAKIAVVSPEGKLFALEMISYNIIAKQPGWAEQTPQDWWGAVILASHKLSPELLSSVSAIGVTGQMHSLVLLGEKDKPLRPAILWADLRSSKEVVELSCRLGEQFLKERLKNPIFTGLTAPCLMWIKKNEPDVFKDIKRVLLPKDYIRLRLTGLAGTEYSDASATGLFDIERLDWAQEALDCIGISPTVLPDLHNSMEYAGGLLEQPAKKLGLKKGIPVVFGGGDQPAAALGNGVISPGDILLTVGTGGQLFSPILRPKGDERLRVHTFCHCMERIWYHMGATLCAGLSLKWLRNNFFADKSYSALDSIAQEIEAGSEGLIYLPYLIGERTPHMDPKARGIFFGVSYNHGPGHFIRAILEGVAYSFKDVIEIIRAIGDEPKDIILAGGGANSLVWRQIIADVLETPIKLSSHVQGSAFGAAFMAGVGSGRVRGIKEGIKECVHYSDEIIEPDKKNSAIYRERFAKYKEIYSRTKELYS